ncbi:MAG: hypothetical protein ACRCTF_05385 [Bacteroidales bacterium]
MKNDLIINLKQYMIYIKFNQKDTSKLNSVLEKVLNDTRNGVPQSAKLQASNYRRQFVSQGYIEYSQEILSFLSYYTHHFGGLFSIGLENRLDFYINSFGTYAAGRQRIDARTPNGEWLVIAD